MSYCSLDFDQSLLRINVRGVIEAMCGFAVNVRLRSSSTQLAIYIRNYTMYYGANN